VGDEHEGRLFCKASLTWNHKPEDNSPQSNCNDNENLKSDKSTDRKWHAVSQ